MKGAPVVGVGTEGWTLTVPEKVIVTLGYKERKLHLKVIEFLLSMLTGSFGSNEIGWEPGVNFQRVLPKEAAFQSNKTQQ